MNDEPTPTPRKRAQGGPDPDSGNVQAQLVAIDAVLGEEDETVLAHTHTDLTLPGNHTIVINPDAEPPSIAQPGPQLLNPDVPKPSHPLHTFLNDDLRRRALAATEPNWVYGNPHEAALVVRELLELLREATR